MKHLKTFATLSIVLPLLSVLLIYISCGQQDVNIPTSPTPPTSPSLPTDVIHQLKITGVLYQYGENKSEDDQNFFQIQLDGFVSSFLNMSENEEEMGTVSGDYRSQSTGVRFGGLAVLEEGKKINPSHPQQSLSESNSSFREAFFFLKIQDSKSVDENQLPIIRESFEFHKEDSFITSENIQITFKHYLNTSEYRSFVQGRYLGYIRLYGHFQEEWWMGKLFYRNALFWDQENHIEYHHFSSYRGAPSSTEHMVNTDKKEGGMNFAIKICDFFECE